MEERTHLVIFIFHRQSHLHCIVRYQETYSMKRRWIHRCQRQNKVINGEASGVAKQCSVQVCWLKTSSSWRFYSRQLYRSLSRALRTGFVRLKLYSDAPSSGDTATNNQTSHCHPIHLKRPASRVPRGWYKFLMTTKPLCVFTGAETALMSYGCTYTEIKISVWYLWLTSKWSYVLLMLQSGLTSHKLLNDGFIVTQSIHR